MKRERRWSVNREEGAEPEKACNRDTMPPQRHPSTREACRGVGGREDCSCPPEGKHTEETQAEISGYFDGTEVRGLGVIVVDLAHLTGIYHVTTVPTL